ncbi:hypothetical protein Desaci_1382 [Desulfosporosinus acidiphilus SJ4]|uniref:Uncharacterized protein n=1 Tax=Desulfosporosinus acidiphilus (strain DSM 22704 / JCM 16185 / SJ4) TaxID=646529 RepID=I4D3N1_DESAJ|nr:hypothetical protein Desaci_1382 [Desulfosporosinus acidiphilus SJ4]
MGKKAKARYTNVMLPVKQQQCVHCQSRAVRSIGASHYFCADCCMEFTICGDNVTMYTISADGGLSRIS